MWVRFLRDFDWSPPEKPRSSIAFKAGMHQNVRSLCASQAIAAEAAVLEPNEARPNGASLSERIAAASRKIKKAP